MKNGNLLTELDERLVNCQIESSRISAARMVGLTKEQQMQLALDKSANVRIALSENPFILPETLEYLSKDADWLVRANVGEHERTPQNVVHILAEDKNLIIRYSALSNPQNEESEFFKKKLDKLFENLFNGINEAGQRDMYTTDSLE